MNQKEILLNSPVRRAEFTVREDFTLAITLELSGTQRQLVLHDFIKKGGHRYGLFHGKTLISHRESEVLVRTAAIDIQDGAPIPGLYVTYRFTFDRDRAAFYLSAGFGGDTGLSGFSTRLLDVSWEGLNVTGYTGYERDALGRPFSKYFPMPEPNPDAPDYETLMRITPHAAWERMKTRPQGFKEAVALHGDNGYLAIYGGTPLYHVEAEYVSVFPGITEYSNDLRFFSGSNSPGAWFVLEEPENLFEAMSELDSKVPALAEHVMVAFPEKTVTLRSGELKLDLLQTKGGVWVKAVTAPGQETSCQPWPLFQLELWDTEYERTVATDSGTGWDRVEILEGHNYARVTLSDPESGRVCGITVIAEAFMDPGQNRISWKLRVVNRSQRWSVCNATYPQCLAQGFDSGYVTMGSGAVFEHFNKHARVFCAAYPLGLKTNMPFTAVYDPAQNGEATNGLYVGVHDPNGNPKALCMAGAPQSQCTMMSTMCAAPYQRKGGNSFTLPGFMVWQAFRGDWFDAVNIYRQFVHTQATWLSPLRGRPDTPQWMREMPVWIMHFMPNENPDANPVPITLREKYPDKDPKDWYRTAVRFREEIGVPVAYHLYNWHWVPFNNDNPNYFPVHHDLKEGMQALKQADIRVIPYIAGYSWDMHDSRGDNYRFEQEALPATAKDVRGNVLSKSYASTEPNGVPVKFARMCPSTAFWKQEIRQVTRRLYTEYGMDGIYLDVVSAAYEQCCDENHLHEPGYGNFWWKAYSELIAGLRADAPEDFAVVSESVSEVYAGALDGYLAWTWVQPDSVPAHPRVYGGRVAVFGRVVTQNKRDDDAYFRFHVAQAFMYGQQLGWIHPEIVDDPKQFPFLKKMAKLRWDMREFFAVAELLRPPVVEGEMSLMDSEPFLRGQFWSHEKSVLASGWEDDCGRRNLFVVNSGSARAEVTVSVCRAEYDLPADLDSICAQDGFELLGIECENGVCKVRCRIAPEGFGVLSW